MKRIACAALTVMVLLTGQSYAEQIRTPCENRTHVTQW